MTINQKGSNSTRVPVNTINTMLEQISDLQEDLATLEVEVDDLGNSVETNNLAVSNGATIAGTTINEQVGINTPKATIGSLGGTNVDVANITATNATVDTVKVQTVEMGQGIKLDAATKKIESTFATFSDATINNATVGSLKVTDNTVVNDLTIDNATVNNVTNNGDYTGKNATVENITVTKTATVKELDVNTKATVKDLEVTGEITGVSEMTVQQLNAQDVESDAVTVKKLVSGSNVMNQTINHLTPTPSLDNNDRYTIELPVFTGRVLLEWKDDDGHRVWSAVVVGDSKDYSIKWATVEDEIKVTEIFEYEDKLWIRTLSNGSLFYSSDTVSDFGEVHIYYSQNDLDTPVPLRHLTDGKHQYKATTPDTEVVFGKMIAPDLTILFANFDSLEVDMARIKTIIGPVTII